MALSSASRLLSSIDPMTREITIEPYGGVEGIRFGASSAAVVQSLGTPTKECTSEAGEAKIWCGGIVWNFHHNKLVECTISMTSPVRIYNQAVTKFCDWLPGADPAIVAVHKFLISYRLGIAVDVGQDLERAWIFQRGRWAQYSSYQLITP